MILADVAPQPDPPTHVILIGGLVVIAVIAAVVLFLRLRKR